MTEDRSEQIREAQDYLACLEEANRLLAAFSHTSAVGFGICDNQLRYQSVNSALAAFNGTPIKAHLGNTVRDVLGEVAESIEPAFLQVLVTGKVVSKEIAGKLRTREGVGHWIAAYFPVKAITSRVRQMGAIAVDVTELKRVDELLARLTYDLHHTPDMERCRAARELHDSVRQYFAVLTYGLGRVTQNIWQRDKSANEQLAPTIEWLDQRILSVRKLVTATAARLPIDRHL